ncbi:mechanosensitive ion channel domain-containing protein [Pararhodobacter sp. SW119]|uniref:mechanosensitive ion channel family protein n=1 Tax=Pararhodobacter sp. SW119 TaxID=2780075 RepID=UPI001AE0CE01|nr:mechanosensitive ion channel domain-containing protein [Pararhodobacter sp. SW119]
MELIDQGILDAGAGLIGQIEIFVRSMLLPWRLYQLAILGVLFAVAHLLGLAARHRLEAWVRSREGWPKWRLRLAVIVSSRMRGAIFVLLAWLVWAVMQQVTWPSRSFLIGLWATIATAWVAVGFAAQFIRNRPLRRAITWLAWTYIALHYLGFLDGAAAFLDSIAVTFDDFRLSALGVLKGLIVTGILLFVARALTQALIRRITTNEDFSPSMRVLSVKAVQLSFFGIAIVIGLRAIGFDLTGLAVLSGAIGLGIGFGLQKVVSNLVSGVIILLDKSIKPGDVISLGETFGWINELGARYVSVVTRDGREYLIPNEDLVTGQVVNWSHSDEFVRIDLHFGTSYADDPHQVRRIAVEAATGVPRVLADREVRCHITDFGDSAINFVLRFWIRDAHEGLAGVRGAVYLALWDAFQAHGITIPFPQRELRVLDSTVKVESAGVAARQASGGAPEPG